MNNTVETIEYRGQQIKIEYDTDPQSPQEWGNDECFLIYDHRDFNVKVKGYDPTRIFEHVQETKKWFYEGYWVFPVYAYIHSDVALSLGRNSYPFTCNWDTSFKGFALVKRQKGWSYSKRQAEKIAQSIVNEWNDYLSGNVYGFIVNDYEDSCWGFYGKEGHKEAISEAKAVIDANIKATTLTHLQTLKQWIKAKVNLMHRKPLQVCTQ